MTTLRVNDNSVVVLIKPGQYRFYCRLGVGFGFYFSLDEQAEEFLSGIITKKTLISPEGRCYAVHVNIEIQINTGINENCPYILTLGLGHDCSEQEAIVAHCVEEVKEEV